MVEMFPAAVELSLAEKLTFLAGKLISTVASTAWLCILHDELIARWVYFSLNVI